MEPIMTDKDLPVNTENTISKKTDTVTPSGFNHSFDVGIAQACGLEAACVYNHLCYWLTHNKIRGTNFHKGKTWTYDTHENMTLFIPYLNARQIKYALQKLFDAKVIIKDNFNTDKFDKTTWYALVDENVLKISNNVYEETNLSDRSTKSEPSMRQNCPLDGTNLSNGQYTYTTLTDTKNNSLKVHDDPADAGAAKAAEDDLLDSSKEKPKKTRTPSEFTPKVKELADKMVNALHQANPDWLIPKSLYHMMNQIHEMLTVEKRDPCRILDVFMWAIHDHFWAKNLAKPNPVKYLRDKFSQLAGAMDAKPAPKERKFAPCSDDSAAHKKMLAMKERAI